MKNPNPKVLFLCLFSACVFSACSKKEEAPSQQIETETKKETQVELSLDEAAADAWFATGEAILTSSLEHARVLQSDIARFLETPNQTGLTTAQNTWAQLAQNYAQFYPWHLLADGDPANFKFLNELHFRIASLPIQPGSLDYFGEYLYSGLVHEVGNPLTMQNLLDLHGQVDSENATLGLYALGFMLFGEEGKRPAGDYTALTNVSAEYKERGFSKTAELPNNRRRLLLSLQSGILVDDLSLLLSLWGPTANNSQTAAWRNQSRLQKQQLLEGSLERGITSLIVIEDYTADKNQLQARLSGLRRLPAILQHPRLQEMNTAFEEIATLIASMDSDTNATDATTEVQEPGIETQSPVADASNDETSNNKGNESIDEEQSAEISALSQQLSRLHKLLDASEEENASL